MMVPDSFCSFSRRVASSPAIDAAGPRRRLSRQGANGFRFSPCRNRDVLLRLPLQLDFAAVQQVQVGVMLADCLPNLVGNQRMLVRGVVADQRECSTPRQCPRWSRSGRRLWRRSRRPRGKGSRRCDGGRDYSFPAPCAQNGRADNSPRWWCDWSRSRRSDAGPCSFRMPVRRSTAVPSASSHVLVSCLPFLRISGAVRRLS